MSQTADLRIRSASPLIAPDVLELEYPVSPRVSAFVEQSRREISAVVSGVDDRLLAIVGPCSVHDPVAAVEYAARLKDISSEYSGRLIVVMRVYFEKPRTVAGWKGLINDPGLDESFQINRGLRTARKLLLEISEIGLPIATEFLDTILGQYYADLISWGAIGARTVESQVHRELASGLSMPVGFKNRTDGDIQVAADAIASASRPHVFPSLTHQGTAAILTTTGNEFGHLVLRGGSRSGPNFSEKHVNDASKILQASGLNPSILVDCSHANSEKKYERQTFVCSDVANQVANGQRAIVGVMMESNLLAGNQRLEKGSALKFGQSITDGCISIEETVDPLRILSEAVQSRRDL
jgi:3-deoxy-7-phosphoheptulonate synthase